MTSISIKVSVYLKDGLTFGQSITMRSLRGLKFSPLLAVEDEQLSSY